MNRLLSFIVAAFCFTAVVSATESVTRKKAGRDRILEVPSVSRTFSVGEFKSLRTTGPVRVVYTPTKGNVRIKADVDERVADLLDVRESGDSLVVGFRDCKPWEHFEDSLHAIVYVDAPMVSYVDLKSVSEVDFMAPIRVSDFTASVGNMADLSFPAFDGSSLSLMVGNMGSVTLGTVSASSFAIVAGNMAGVTVESTTNSDEVKVRAGNMAGVSLKGGVDCKTLDLSAGNMSQVSLDGLLDANTVNLSVGNMAGVTFHTVKCGTMKGTVSAMASLKSDLTDVRHLDVDNMPRASVDWGKRE